MKKSCDIYGPDLSVHEAQGKAIADTGLRCMQGTSVVSKAEPSTGKDASDSELSHLLPKKE